MTELELMNHPANKLATKLIKQTGENPNPEILPILRLAQVFLETKVTPSLEMTELANSAYQMEAQPKETVACLLTSDPEQLDLDRAENPKLSSQLLSDALDVLEREMREEKEHPGRIPAENLQNSLMLINSGFDLQSL